MERLLQDGQKGWKQVILHYVLLLGDALDEVIYLPLFPDHRFPVGFLVYRGRNRGSERLQDLPKSHRSQAHLTFISSKKFKKSNQNTRMRYGLTYIVHNIENKTKQKTAANTYKLGDFTIPRFLAFLKMLEDPAKWVCRLVWLQLELGSCCLLKMDTHPPLSHGPYPAHLLWPPKHLSL